MVFQGIILEISTIKVLTVEKIQFKALHHKMPEIELNITYTIKASICFGSRKLLSLIGIVQIFTLVNITNFYNVNISTPFFLCLKKINILSIYLNNMINQLIY